MFRGDLQHTGVYEAEGVPELDGVKWKFESMGSDQYSLTGASRNIPVIAGEVRASPAIGGGGVYFGSDDGHLYALE
jgi:outer membrane protein assembly factor BamB